MAELNSSGDVAGLSVNWSNGVRVVPAKALLVARDLLVGALARRSRWLTPNFKAREAVLGRALKDFASRGRVVIATKVCNPMGDEPNQRGLSRKHIMHSIDDSLRRLQTDYVDLYQIHRFDYETPIEETLEALDDVLKSGKALYIGASSMYAWQFAKMLYTADEMGLTRFVTMQNHYNMIYREEEREMTPLCREEGSGVNPGSPLAL